MPAITQTSNANSRWAGTVPGSADLTITAFRLYQAPVDLIASYQLVKEIPNPGAGAQPFGTLGYSKDLFVVRPTSPFFLKCTQVQNGKETELAAEPALRVAPSAIPGWSLGDLMAQGMRPTLVVGFDPVSGMCYPINVVPDVANGGFQLKVDNS